MKISYPAHLEQQENGRFLVQFIDLDNAFTEGATKEEALFNATEVLTLILEDRIESGISIPLPSVITANTIAIAPDTSVQSALLIKFARNDRPISEIAHTLNTSWMSAQRLEDPHHWPSLKQLDRAAKALGKRLILSLE